MSLDVWVQPQLAARGGSVESLVGTSSVIAVACYQSEILFSTAVRQRFEHDGNTHGACSHLDVGADFEREISQS